MTVSELSERELIARIRQKLAPPPPWMVVGIGDDAAVVEPVRNQLDVMTVDAIVEGVHFDRRFTPPEAIGHRALAVNLSDLAAMGAEPRLALLSLALPSTLAIEDFDAIIAGVAAVAVEHRVHVAGGNLTRSPGPLVLDVTAIGSAKRRSILTRSGAKPGDDVYVTGTVGSARAGLQQLTVRLKSDPTTESASDVGSGFSRTVIDRYFCPQPRVRTGVLLGRNRAATACMDLSDGLADGIRQLSDASGVGMTIDPSSVPIDGDACAWFESQGADPLNEALMGGDDYELLFTASPKRRGRLKAVARHGGVPLTRIGVCTPDRELRIGAEPGRTLPHGFSHFR